MIAVVRDASDADAAKRLRAAYDGADAELLSAFDDLSAQHLTVYAGMPLHSILHANLGQAISTNDAKWLTSSCLGYYRITASTQSQIQIRHMS